MEAVNVQAYLKLFESTKEPFLYSAPWWLDATCGRSGWDAIVAHGAGQSPIAGLPYQVSRIRGLSAITTPPLTQWVSVLAPHGIVDPEHLISLSSLPKASILDLAIRPDEKLLTQDGIN